MTIVAIERGRRYHGVYQPDPTQPGNLVEGMILGDKVHGEDWKHGIAWLCSDDATIYPVAKASLSLLA